MTTVATVSEYIETQAAAVQPRLRELRAIIRAAAPQATEVISYGMPTYKFGGRTVHFGAAKRHCALYGSAIDLFTNELRDFKTLKGTVQFPLDRPIPEKLVHNLVTAKLFDRLGQSANGRSAGARRSGRGAIVHGSSSAMVHG